MLRLGDKTFLVGKDGRDDIFIRLYNQDEEPSKEENLQLHTNLINNYKDFIKELKNWSRYGIEMYFFVALNPEKKEFYFFRELLSTTWDKCWGNIFTYKPENENLYELTKNILRMSDTKLMTDLLISKDNNFNLIANPYILDIVYTKHMIESKGEILFNKFQITNKNNGKKRDIVAPHEEIKKSLQKLNTLLQKVYDRRNNKFQVAYKKKKNVKSGAELHAKNKYVFNIDLHHFYQSCKKELVKKYTDFLFYSCFNRNFLEKEFFDVILIDDGLFIGSPVSGVLANTIISMPVLYLNNICKKCKITLSVYADDMSFSSSHFIDKDLVINFFEKAFSRYGLNDYFKLSEEKSVGFTGCNRKITGVVINDSDKITVPRKYYRNLRVTINHLSKGENINLQVLRGQLAYAIMIDESGKIFNYLKKYEQIISENNLVSEEKMNQLKEKFESAQDLGGDTE